jgi:UDP-glucuronate decarboxylase
MLDEIIRKDIEHLQSFKYNIDGESALITGGAGFIGSWLSEILVGLDVRTVCLDNLSSGSLSNIEHLRRSDRFTFVQSDLEDLGTAGDNYNFILHLASRASPEDYQAYPVETLKVNSLGTLKALEIARKDDAKFLFTSTSEVYGDAKIIPTPETYWGNVNPIGPRSPYDESKRFSEALCKAYGKTYGLDIRIVRIFNTYGPRLRPEGLYGRAVSRFIMQATQGQDITVYGDGSQTISFCYITDTIKGILSILTKDSARGEVMNIGNPDEITILELAKKIKTLTNSSSKITFHPMPEDDPRRRLPDTTKAERLLNWNPQIPLEEGLNRTITWLTKQDWT